MINLLVYTIQEHVCHTTITKVKPYSRSKLKTRYFSFNSPFKYPQLKYEFDFHQKIW